MLIVADALYANASVMEIFKACLWDILSSMMQMSFSVALFSNKIPAI